MTVGGSVQYEPLWWHSPDRTVVNARAYSTCVCPKLHRQFVSFCFVGGISFIVDNGVLSLMVRVVGLSPITGRIVSLIVAMTGSWVMNRTLTFRNRRDQPLWQEYLRFCLANGVGNLCEFPATAVIRSWWRTCRSVPTAFHWSLARCSQDSVCRASDSTSPARNISSSIGGRSALIGSNFAKTSLPWRRHDHPMCDTGGVAYADSTHSDQARTS